MAIRFGDQEVVKYILEVVAEENILEEALAGTDKGIREELKGLLKEAGDQDMLDKILQYETRMAANKAKKTGIACGVIAGLAVGVGCFAAGTALPILAIAGIALASALLVGLVAGYITYAVSKPSSKVEETDAQQGQDPLSQGI